MDNLPIAPLTDRVENIIAVNISPIEKSDELDSMVKIAGRVFQMSVSAQTHSRKEKCMLFLEPQGVRGYELFDVKKADELFELGYKHVMDLNFDPAEH